MDDEPPGPHSLDRATALLEELPGAVLLLDPSGVVRYLNRIAEHRIDHARADTVGRDFFRDVLPQLEREGVGERYRCAMRSQPVSLAWESALAGAEGERRIGFGMRSCEGPDGGLGLVLLEDRTPLWLEAARRMKAERLAAVGELAAGAAHEINNPLASIKGFAQLLSRDTLDRGQQQALEVISQECSRVARIVDSLLDFANQQRMLEPEPVNVSEVAEAILALRRYSLETGGVVLDVDLEPALSLIDGEKGAIQRLILILLNQAERSLALAPGERRLRVWTRESNDGIALYVSDSGPGVPRHRLPQILEPESDPPAGLGLSAAREIARDHGGSLWVESGEGRGTAFIVRLPRGGAAVPGSADAAADPLSAAGASAPRPARILVADDEPTLRLALAMFLARHGYQVDQAEDAEQAYRMTRRTEYDVALVDVRMPGDGIALLERLDIEPHWHGRTILMTGDQTQPRVRQEIRAGRPHLTKPFDLTDAVRLIESLSRAGEESRPERRPSPWMST